ncbi:MAG TPA: phage tail sheath subtilisin-like domain-containing protein [Pyrinomonadaceae bacterium]
MPASYKTPGVYRREIFLRPETPFETGVPAFVGFVSEVFADAKGGPRLGQPFKLSRKEEFVATFRTPADGYLADAVKGFFGNGGTSCYVVPVDPAMPDREAALKKAIDALAPVEDFDLLAVPDAMLLSPRTKQDTQAVVRVQQHALAHCAEQNNRFAILDALPERTTETVIAQRETLTQGQPDQLNGALYYPWIQVFDPATGKLRAVPPCGHVAGIYARTDARVGVFKAPANEEVLGAINLETNVDNRAQEQLNPQGVNCLRAFAGRGIRVWGARTLSRDNAWRYVNVRRQFLTINRWVEINLAWAAFEPNAPRLWVRISRELSQYLETLWYTGALKGESRDEAFYVKCDEETNPAETREAGRAVTELGLALAAPAEFVVVRIFHRAATAVAG